MALRQLLIKHEGLKLKPYEDSVGKLTIGVGRNLEDVGLSMDEALMLLDNDIARVTRETDFKWPWVLQLSYPRKCVVYSMAFNIGLHGLSLFKKFLAALEANNFDQAASEMLNSKWASQVGKRAFELSEIMRTGLMFDGTWPEQ